MQQDQQQQQRQQRVKDKESQQKESVRGARVTPPLLLSRCLPTGKNCHYILPDWGITLGVGYLQSRLLA